MFKLMKVTAIISVATVLTGVAGVIKAKFTALALGPSGVGIFSQAYNFQFLLVNLSSLSIGLGVTKYVSHYLARDEEENARGMVYCALWMQILFSLAIVAVTFILSPVFSRLVFSDPRYSLNIFIVSLGIPFLVLGGTVEAALLGYGNYKAFANSRGITNLLLLIPLIFFISLLGLEGAFIYLAASGVATAAVYYFFLRRYTPLSLTGVFMDFRKRKNALLKFSTPLLRYGGVMFITGVMGVFNVVFLRALIIRYFGTEANGYYQVVFTLSTYYMVFFTNGLWSYFYPKLSSLQERSAQSEEINSAMRFCTFGIVIFMVGIFLFKDMIINIVFSREFAASRELFATQLFGDLFFILCYIINTSLLANAKLRDYFIFALLYSAAFIGFFLLLKDSLGLKAMTVSYLISNIATFLVLIYHHMKKMDFIIERRNAVLLASGIALCLLVFTFGQGDMKGISFSSILLITWLVLSPTSSERHKISSVAWHWYKEILR